MSWAIVRDTMSVRYSIHEPAQAANGSLFGPPLGYWQSMCISPTESPADTSSSLPTSAASAILRLKITDDFSLRPVLQALDTASPLQALTSAIHMWEVPVEELHACAYVFFEELPGETVAWHSKAGERRSQGAVVPRVVMSDTVSWLPLLSDQGHVGFSFSLKLEGLLQSTVQIFDDDQIVVAHASYSPLAVEANMASSSTRLVFAHDHDQRLAEVVAEVVADFELGYLPVGEVLAGRGLDRIAFRRRGGDGDERALKKWNQAKERLRALNKNAVTGIETQNARELSAAGVCSSEISLPSLDQFFNCR